jgi:hypothetical protein
MAEKGPESLCGGVHAERNQSRTDEKDVSKVGG